MTDNIPVDSNISEEFCYYERNILTMSACTSPSDTSFSHFHFCYGKFLDTQLKFTNAVTLTLQKKGNSLAIR